MKYAEAGLELEFAAMHPEVRMVAYLFDAWCGGKKYAEPVITDVHRSPNFYSQRNLKPVDSWHLYDCAVDFRTHIYSPIEYGVIKQWWGMMCADRTRWELITEPHGTGPHLHVARRDHRWKEAYRRGSKIKIP